MQLASIRYEGKDVVGIRRGETEIALVQTLRGGCDRHKPDMIDLISAGPDAMAEAAATENRVSIDEVTFRPPLPRPGKVVCVAMNNSASNERKISAPDHPAFFLKPTSCLVAHNEAVRVRPYYGSVHPEPELAVVIGSTTRDVDAGSALSAVFGYTIFNDITGNAMRADDLFHYWALYGKDREPQKLERREQHLSYAARYKGTDTFGCMGPWLVTRDEVPDPDNLAVQCHVGGEQIAADNTSYYNFRIAEIISYLSHFLTLHPGDVLSCGTAFKSSPGRKSIHLANLQKEKGPIEVTIDGLGTLRNPVIREDISLGQWRLPGVERQSGGSA